MTGNALGKLTPEVQRKIFKQTEHAINKRQYTKARQLQKKLKGYALYPYLDYAIMRKTLHQKNTKQVKEFLRKYNNTPLADRLKRQWLGVLAKKNAWQTFAQEYKPYNSKTLECNYLWAQVQNKHKNKNFNHDVEKLWLYGKSQPKACDKVFAYWRRSGQLNSKLVWERIRLALDERQLGLVNHLGKYLSARDRQQLKLAQKIDRKPELISQKSLFNRRHPFTAEIIVHGMQRLADTKLDYAKRIWSKTTKHYHLNKSQKARVLQEIAMKSAVRNKPDAAKWLAMIPASHVDETVRQWRVRNALLDLNWSAVLHWITVLSGDEKKADEWRYWQARALSESGGARSAEQIFNALAQSDDYYGLLSAERITKPYNIQHKIPKVSQHLMLKVKKHPAIKRARELYKIGKFGYARSEWHFALNSMSQKEQQAAARLAQLWGWHDRAIATANQSDLKHALKMRFPLANQKHMIKEAKRRQIDPAWTFAIARQESMFIHDAKSYMGALGIMQIMPQTAYHIAKDFRFRYRRRSELLNSATNIRFGTAYLKQMYDMYGQNPVLATAAYNAGPHRVSQWLPEKALPADIWIDTIPFYETRDYLKKVLTYAVYYEYHLGKKPKLSRRMKMVALKDVNIPGR